MITREDCSVFWIYVVARQWFPHNYLFRTPCRLQLSNMPSLAVIYRNPYTSICGKQHFQIFQHAANIPKPGYLGNLIFIIMISISIIIWRININTFYLPLVLTQEFGQNILVVTLL